MRRVVAYLRVSSEEQRGSGLGFDAQRSMVEAAEVAAAYCEALACSQLANYGYPVER